MKQSFVYLLYLLPLCSLADVLDVTYYATSNSAITAYLNNLPEISESMISTNITFAEALTDELNTIASSK